MANVAEMGDKSMHAGLVISGILRRVEEVKKLPFYSQPKAIRELEEATKQLLRHLHREIILLEQALKNEKASNEKAAKNGQVILTGLEGFKWQVTL